MLQEEEHVKKEEEEVNSVEEKRFGVHGNMRMRREGRLRTAGEEM